MRLVLLAAVLALCAAPLLGGRWGRLGRVRLRRRWLLVVAVAVQAAGGLLAAGRAWPAGLAGSAVLAAAFVAANRGRPGLLLAGAGLALNAVVVAANGAMPVAPPALAAAGLDPGAVDLSADPRHVWSGSGTRLPLLGDVVPVPVPRLREAVSPGDTLLAAGTAWFLLAATGAVRGVWDHGRQPVPHERPSPQEDAMAKRGRKRKARAKSKANHGRRPNA